MFELAVIEQLKKDVGHELLPKLFDVFSKESESLCQQILTVEILDTETIRLCHSLKSSAKTYGAMPLAHFAEALEALAKQQQSSFFQKRQEIKEVVTNTINHIPTSLKQIEN